MKKNNKFDMNELKKKIPKDHSLKTRRDFLSHGLISGMGIAYAPSLISLLRTEQVFAAENCLDTNLTNNRKLPIIMIDLSGGANIPGSNIIVGGAGGQNDFLASYQSLGLPADRRPQMSGMINSELGLKFHTDSGMLNGIRNATTAQVRQKVEGGLFVAFSENDTQNNPHNPMYWLNKAGATGKIVQTIGTSTSKSGGRSQIPNLSYDPTIAPVPIRNASDAAGLADLGRVSSLFNASQIDSILRATNRMSENQLSLFSRRSLPDQIREVVGCGFASSNIKSRIKEFNPNIADLNPLNDPDVMSVYANAAGNNEAQKQAAVASLVLNGYVGTGTIEMGGYDYHNNDRSVTNERDRLAGEAIGRILSLASLKESDVLIYVYTDGGVNSRSGIVDAGDTAANGYFRWQSDDSRRSGSYLLYYKHNGGRPELRHTDGGFANSMRQIGYMRENESVETGSNQTSNNVVNLAKAVVLNYLALLGEENRIEEIVGDNPFSSKFDDYIFFKKNVA